jgi:hypothetical protein
MSAGFGYGIAELISINRNSTYEKQFLQIPGTLEITNYKNHKWSFRKY